jgi:hypothetical protein
MSLLSEESVKEESSCFWDVIRPVQPKVKV